MKQPLVVLTHPFIPRLIDSELRPHARVELAQTPTQLKKLLANADGLITQFTQPVTAVLLQQAPHLKAIANFAVGYDNIDLAACANRGVRVCNTPDVLTRATAELALTLLLSAARRVVEGDQLCRTGQFKGWAPDMLLGLELKGRRAVLVGRGRIGRETARLFEGIGLQVDWITRTTPASEIRRKLQKAQVISLHTPFTTDTRHWLNASRMALLPHDAIVINTTRGPVVDEKALLAVLRSRRIFAAGLDVYEREPEIPKALRKLSNVVLLPHLGSATVTAREGMAHLAITGLLALLSGKAPPNEVKFGDHGQKPSAKTRRSPNHSRL
jgi:glyoxylate reductase